MSYTLSTMMELGTKAPKFKLFDVISKEEKSLDELKSDKATVVMFICNHCPYVIYLFRHLMDFVAKYQAKGVKFIAISSNDVDNYPLDSPDKMEIVAKVLQFQFPYLYDETQEVAKAYDAACTPDFFVFDEKLELAYRGQYDDARPNKGVEITGKDLGGALDAILKGQKPDERQYPSGGCNIKWKA